MMRWRVVAFVLIVTASTPAAAQPVFSESIEGPLANATPTQSAAIDRIKADKATRSVSIVRVDGALLKGAISGKVELNLRSDLKLDALPRSIQPLTEGR